VRALRILEDDVDTLAADGRVVHLRDLGPADLPELLALHDRASDRSIYLRYFSPNREAARRYVTTLVEPRAGRHVLGAFVGYELVGVGLFDTAGDGDDPEVPSAEFALLVADSDQHGGIGTLLLEHMVAEARGAGVRRFTAEVLASNALMLKVIHDLGFEPKQRIESGETHVEFDLVVGEPVIEAISAREESAGAASLRPLLAPRSVVVIGAGHRPGTVGHEVLRNLLAGGFTGPVYAVNPNRNSVLSVPCFPSAAELPETPDLAVIALPAEHVAAAVRACGERGVRAAILLSSGFGESGPDGAAKQDEVLAIAREHGVRLLGPNCVGVVNTDPAIRLDSTFALANRRPGPLAVLAQSGAFGIAMLEAAGAIGLGVSQFVSIGNKIDVGGNDLLLAWDNDPRTKVIGAYFESIGDPARFARIAGRIAQHKPVLVVKSGRTDVGRRAGRSHTGAAASSDLAVDALFRDSGVLRLHTMRELLDAARVLTGQPLPAGPRVAIVGNSGGPEILAADTAADAGLVVPEMDEHTVARLAELGVPASSPLDLGAAAQPGLAEDVLRIVAESPVVDAVVAVFTDVAVADPTAMLTAVAAAAAASPKPFVAVRCGSPAATLALDDEWSLPLFTFPEEAVAALGIAHRYVQRRANPPALATRPDGVDVAGARAVVDAALAGGREWLDPAECDTVLRAYGLPVCRQALAADADEAVARAADLGYPIVAKLAGNGLHKSDLGGVRLDLADEADLRAAVDELTALHGGPVLLQPMISGGTELIVGAVHDPSCGPLVMVGAGGVLTDVLEDRAFGLAPLLTERAARELVDRLRTARLLDGYRGAPFVSRGAIADVLVRVAALVDDVPQIAELDLNPLICRGEGIEAVDARIRVAEPPTHPDPLVRQLRGPRGGH